MMMTQDHHHRPFSSSSDGGGGGGANEVSVVVGRSTCMSSHTQQSLPPFSRNLQLSTTASSVHSLSTPKSPGGGIGIGIGIGEEGIMAATMEFPFTTAQWKELQRQAMIYKYMVASVPVPPDLLFPVATTTPISSSHCCSPLGSKGSMLNLRFSSSGRDAEPGRCKRTDGKKWRCSRDVAPHQKYCERHMHRGRPRSRKPVEEEVVHHHPPFTAAAVKKTRLHENPNPPASMAAFDNTPIVHTNNNISTSFIKKPTRGLDWTMEGEICGVYGSEHQWQELIQSSVDLATDDPSIYSTNSSIFRENYRVEPLDMISYTDLGAPVNGVLNNCHTLFLNADDLGYHLDKDTPRGFIDAWSNDSINSESSVSSQGNLSPSSLTLSVAMAAGNVLDEEMCRIQMGSGLTDSEENPQITSWINPVSWMGLAPGGPLAEALRPCSASNSDHPIGGNGTSSPSGFLQGTMLSLSSPSGVLQRTMLSISESTELQ